MASRRERAVAAQKIQQREQRQSQDGEEIALDTLEELRAQTFELVGAHGVQELGRGGSDIVVEKAVAEAAHNEVCAIDGVPDEGAVSHDRRGGDERVPLAAEQLQLR